jgi:hypothetical protein
MAWWTLIEPWDRAVLLILNVATIGGLLVEHRRARRAHEIAEEAHRLAKEAHEWGRERVERERDREGQEQARREWCDQMRRKVEASQWPVDIPDGVPMDWVLSGENERYFKRIREPGGRWQVWRYGTK